MSRTSADPGGPPAPNSAQERTLAVCPAPSGVVPGAPQCHLRVLSPQLLCSLTPEHLPIYTCSFTSQKLSFVTRPTPEHRFPPQATAVEVRDPEHAHLVFKHPAHCSKARRPEGHSAERRCPTFWAPGAPFTGDNCSMGWGWDGGTVLS